MPRITQLKANIIMLNSRTVRITLFGSWNNLNHLLQQNPCNFTFIKILLRRLKVLSSWQFAKFSESCLIQASAVVRTILCIDVQLGNFSPTEWLGKMASFAAEWIHYRSRVGNAGTRIYTIHEMPDVMSIMTLNS